MDLMDERLAPLCSLLPNFFMFLYLFSKVIYLFYIYLSCQNFSTILHLCLVNFAVCLAQIVIFISLSWLTV